VKHPAGIDDGGLARHGVGLAHDDDLGRDVLLAGRLAEQRVGGRPLDVFGG